MERERKLDEEESAIDGAAEGELVTNVQGTRVEEPYEMTPPPHSLLSVLFPSKPPRPRNARVVRLFEVEAGENDGDPGESQSAHLEKERLLQERKDETRSREARRASRNQSLLVAARHRLA